MTMIGNRCAFGVISAAAFRKGNPPQFVSPSSGPGRNPVLDTYGRGCLTGTAADVFHPRQECARDPQADRLRGQMQGLGIHSPYFPVLAAPVRVE